MLAGHPDPDPGLLDRRRDGVDHRRALAAAPRAPRSARRFAPAPKIRIAARLMGIDVPRMTLLSFGLAALIGGVGGILVAPITSLQFDTGRFFTIFRLHCRRDRRHGLVSPARWSAGCCWASPSSSRPATSRRCSPMRSRCRSCWWCCSWRPHGLFPSGAAAPQRRARRAQVHRAGDPPRRPRRRRPRRAGVRCAVRAAVILAAGRGILSSLVITGILFIARARARRADGLCRAGQPWPGRLHGDRRLYRGYPRD